MSTTLDAKLDAALAAFTDTLKQGLVRPMQSKLPPKEFSFSKWRHGGWYVNNVRYPSGACGCVSNNYPDRKWRIACDPRDFDIAPTFKTRNDAALAEWFLAHEDTRP